MTEIQVQDKSSAALTAMSVGFLDMSAEVRNMIYEHAYCELEIRFTRYSNPSRHKRPLGKAAYLPLLRLLRTNRQMSVEVASIVYGHVKLVGVEAATVAWLGRIGSMMKSIRHVSIVTGRRTPIVTCLDQLRQAECLRTLNLHGEMRYVLGRGQIENMARLLSPFIKALYRQRKDTSTKHDVIQIIHTPSQTNRQPEYQEALRARLSELLR